MLKEIKDNWIKLILIIPIMFQVFGILINSIYLAQYDIYDIVPLKIFQMLSGIVFTIFIGISFFAFTVDTDIKDPYKTDFLLVKTGYRIVMCTNIVFLFLFIGELEQIQIWDINVNERILSSALLYCTFPVTIRAFWGNKLERESLGKIGKILIETLNYSVAVLNIALFLILYWKVENYVEIAKFYIFFGLFLYIMQTARSGIRKAKLKDDYKPIFNFSSTGEYIKLDSVFAIFCLLISFVGIIQLYSNRIYKYIPFAYGGGKSINVELKTGENIIEGELIYQNEDYFYLKDENKLLILQRSKIEEIVKRDDKSK